MKKSTVTLLVGGVVGMMAVLLRGQDGVAPSAELAPPKPEAPAPASTEGAGDVAPPTPEAPPRTRIPPRPRPAAARTITTRTGAAAGSTSGATVAQEEAARAERLKQAITDRMAEVSDDISACIDDWAAAEPGMDGRVVVRFALEAEGLTDAWIEEHEGVPAGPLSCFSAAVWDVDWSGVSDAPVEITFPFQVTTDRP